MQSPNAKPLEMLDDLFLDFAFCFGSLQITTNAKSIMQNF